MNARYGSVSELVAALRRWTEHHDAHVRAAVELLIWHEMWLRRPDFKRACLQVDPEDNDAWIRWADAREFVDGKPRASASELAILDLAVALGEDRFRLASMGNTHSLAIARAVAAAVRAAGGAR